MRIDIVTIFPEFFSVLDVSLLGKARQTGLLELGVHDLRGVTHDRHRTVDDTPYGGGAGMVMKPEPWGEAFDSILTPESVVIFPSPAGERFTQATARELGLTISRAASLNDSPTLIAAIADLAANGAPAAARRSPAEGSEVVTVLLPLEEPAMSA